MGKVKVLTAPCLLGADHNLAVFDCGESVMNDWLKRRAAGNQLSGASRTFVVADGAKMVRGYYALAAGAVDRSAATSAIRRNMPDPIPVMVLGRLAVDLEYHGKGLGSDLLQDAIFRTTRLAQEVGIRALVVHALHDQARAFYLHHGFRESEIDPLVLMLRIESRGGLTLL